MRQITFGEEPRRSSDNEVEFRIRLASILRNEPFNHAVYFHEGTDLSKFTMKDAAGYPDLYVQTNAEWPYQYIFPVIAIETKLPNDLNWTARHALKQVTKYHSDTKARYFIDAAEVSAPNIILLASPDSVAFGGDCAEGDEVIYWWRNPKYRTEREVWAASHGITEFLQRQLQDVGAAIMRDKRFQSNISDSQGNKGPMRWYQLWT